MSLSYPGSDRQTRHRVASRCGLRCRDRRRRIRLAVRSPAPRAPVAAPQRALPRRAPARLPGLVRREDVPPGDDARLCRGDVASGRDVGAVSGVVSELTFRPGRASDLQAVYALGEIAWDESRRARGLITPDEMRTEEELLGDWRHERPLIEFMTAQEAGSYVVCEDGDDIVGYAVVVRFGSMDELAELWVAPSHAGRGVSRGLLERCWPDSPTPDLGRVVVAVGTPADLTLFTEFGVMPVSGHWQMRHRVDQYL